MLEDIDELKKVLHLIWDQSATGLDLNTSHIECLQKTSGFCECGGGYLEHNYYTEMNKARPSFQILLFVTSHCFLRMKLQVAVDHSVQK